MVMSPFLCHRCGNVAAILELDEHLQKEFIIFEAAPQETRGIPSKKPVADYFLWASCVLRMQALSTGSGALCVLVFLFLFPFPCPTVLIVLPFFFFTFSIIFRFFFYFPSTFTFFNFAIKTHIGILFSPTAVKSLALRLIVCCRCRRLLCMWIAVREGGRWRFMCVLKRQVKTGCWTFYFLFIFFLYVLFSRKL